MSYGKPGRRVVVTEFGSDPLDAIANYLKIEEQQPPDPATLAPSDVVIAIRSAAIGWVDLLMSSGQYQHMASPPYCPGLEYSGEVAWTGPDVKHVSVGDAVMGDGMLTGPRSVGAYQAYGGFASYAVAPAEAVMPMPSTLSFDQACNMSGYETAYHCLIHRGKLQPGEVVLLHGSSGTTGVAAIQIAKLVGATVIATGRSPAKLAVAVEQGADHVVRVTDDEGAPRRFRDDVKRITEGRGVDVVYDPVGGTISVESLRCVRFGARFLIVGWAATPLVAKGKGQRGAPNANVLPTNLIMMKSLDVLGCPAAISVHEDPSIRTVRLEQLMTWIQAGEITPHVSRTYPMSEIHEAMRDKWASRFAGCYVLHPD
jgi:NADPH2:quinone reductase